MAEKTRTFKILPAAGTIPASVYQQFFGSIAAASFPLEFIINASPQAVSYKVSCGELDAALLRRQLELHFPAFAILDEPLPDAEMSPEPAYFIHLDPQSGISTEINAEFSLDPYHQLFGVLEEFPNGNVEISLTIVPFPAEATTKLIAFLEEATKHYRDEQKTLIKKRIKTLEQKQPAWLIGVVAGTTDDEKTLLQSLAGSFLSQYTGNRPRVVSFGEIKPGEWLEREHSPFFLAGAKELANFIRFPVSELVADRLEVVNMKAKLPPTLYTSGETCIGVSAARGQTQTVYLPDEVRDRHLYIVGKSGTGKSTLVEQIAMQDIKNGMGVAVIDPHGDLIRNLLKWMPDRRASDCIYFSPKESPVSLKILTAETEQEIDLLSDDLLTMFRRTSESWGDKMQAILQMTFQTLLRVPGTSFTDVTPLLTDAAYRKKILAKINHPQLLGFWQNRYDVRQAEPILIRMDRLTTSGALRAVLTQHDASLNFYEVVTNGKILLADISKGFLGESTSHLLGSIIVSQIQLAAMRQAQLPAGQRVPFSLFVDEVQNFTTSAFSTILSEARKYKLRLTMAHQFVSQLPPDIQKSIFGNVGTMVFFALSPDDLGAARHELGTYEAADVANLPKYNAICRPATAARDSFSFVTLPPPDGIPGESYTNSRQKVRIS